MEQFLKLNYPYYNLYYDFNKKKIKKIIKDFKPIIYTKIPDNMKHIKFDKYENKYFIIYDNWETNLELNRITDYFSEKARVKCSFGKYIAPYDYWQQNKKYILTETVKQYKKLSISNIQEIINQKNKLCNNFRISVAMAVLQYFKPKTWLDISAGWGDRLLAAIFSNLKLYYSVDPNKDLHPCYKNMIETLVEKKNRKNFVIIEDGFEKVKLPNIKFDIVFSSPPFFTLEIYSKHENDSLVNYGSSELHWFDNFLMPCIIKACNHIEIGGHFVLYIGTSYMDKIFENLKSTMNYKGIIYFYDTKDRKMFVWQKIK